MRIARVAMVVHDGKAGALEMAADLRGFFEERGIEVAEEDADLVVSLGGDGTMLRAAQIAHSQNAPLLGVNLGALGYLTEIDAGKEKDALERIFNGEFEIEERVMLRCEIGGEHLVALNEVLVERSSRYRLVRLQVRIGGERLAAFNADGVLVATPTGSTAYALSAGGPIVSPKAQCLVVVPVSAHMIFSRPFVLSAEEVVEVTVDQDSGDAYLSADGAIGRELPAGSTVIVRRDERPLRLIRVEGPGFIERLRIKLDLPR
jgi:NAD+ kinase